MVTKTKAKPAAKKAPVKKATKAAAKAPANKAPAKVIENGMFAKFTGYRSEVAADEAIFTEGDVVYIIESEETESGLLYSAIKAEDVGEFLENGDESVEGGQVAGSEVSELKGGALDKAREAFVPIVQIGRMEELLSEAGDDAIAAAVELNQQIQENYFYMGGALAMILQSGVHLVENGGEYEGEDAFNDFCQAEFGFKASKGRQLARIYATFSSIPDFEPDSLRGIGWSIAGKIEKYVTNENFEEVIEAAAAPDVTQRTVDTVMREKFVEADGKSASGRATTRGEKLVTVNMSFRLSEDSAETVKIALQQFMKQRGVASEELALEGIMVEWGQEHIETKTAKQKLGARARKAAAARENKEAGTTKAPAKKAPTPRAKKAA